MRILITNDDGILAPGIAALYEAVAPFGHVDVVAPETTQSAMAHAITVRSPMAVRRVHVNNRFHGWSVDGRPADCVKLAMVELLEERPDFVLSGINAGANTGINVLYSGTVAGAIEGAFFGVPAIAFSLQLSDELDFGAAGRIAGSVFNQIATHRIRPGTCFNINIPALDAGPPLGVRCCAQATVPMREHYRHEKDTDGSAIYWLDGTFPNPADCPGSDHATMHDRYVTVTPLLFDLTDHPLLGELNKWDWPSDL
ncbi:MAG: 5'/3'-nucleotidase SurE [Phycisphaerae bacterium]|nr:5'/3'-nucleotidase SurE [Phycisphaerae bacterium]